MEDENHKLNKIIKELSEKLDNTNNELNEKNFENDKNDLIIEENCRLKESLKFYKNQISNPSFVGQIRELKKIKNPSQFYKLGKTLKRSMMILKLYLLFQRILKTIRLFI